MLSLTLKQPPPVPLEAEVLSPDVIAPLGLAEVRALPLHLGKHRCRLDEFFEVQGTPGEELRIEGDAARVKWIGRGMSRGRIQVLGNVGMHLGSAMQGGVIEVSGNASDWVGAEMTGGLIRVAGNAGGQVGGAYRGSVSGMRDGTILVGGSAGLEVGVRMRRGTIVVGGPVRDFAGLQMKGGTLLLLGGAELRTGAWMQRGTIVSLAPIPLLPTFRHTSSDVPDFLRLYARFLEGFGFRLPVGGGAYARHAGDSAVPGKGEILVWGPHAA